MERYIPLCKQIGDEILARVRSVDYPEVYLDIYQGRAGLILFFIRLYHLTSDTVYLDFVRSEADSLCEERLNDINYSFFTGKLGIAYTLSRVGDLLGEDRYHTRAVSIVEECRPVNAIPPAHINDLLTGKAGIILGLIQIHNIYKNDWILDDIEYWFHELMSDVNVSKAGIYFDRSELHESGLCGFSHGGSGIAFVLFELAYYFDNDAFCHLAELAMSHEDPYYISESKNWNDLRFKDKDGEIVRHYEKYGEIKFPPVPEMSLWCNGAPGIVLAAMRGYELTGKQLHLDKLDNAIENTVESLNTLKKLSLCHGLSGNGSILLSAYYLLNRSLLKESCLALADRLINTNPAFLLMQTKFYPSYSLFLGPAGIGYFLAGLALNSNESILYPTVLKKSTSYHAFLSDVSAASLYKSLYREIYPRTVGLLGPMSDWMINKFSTDFRTTFRSHIRKIVEVADDDTAEDAFEFEEVVFSARYGHDANHSLQVVETIKKKQSVDLFKAAPYDSRVVLSENVVLISTKWDWFDPNWKDNKNREPFEYFGMVLRRPEGSYERKLDELNFRVLSEFLTAGPLNQKVDDIKNHFELDSNNQSVNLEMYVVSVIEQGVKSGIIRLTQ